MQPVTLLKKAYADAISDRALTDESNAIESSFGCGELVPWANLQLGERVMDLGSGAGSDCLEAAVAVGSCGLVIGVDFTAKMVDLACARARRSKLEQVQFIIGDIRSLPSSDSNVDVVLSNCTLNLVSNRINALKEAFRVLIPGGRLLLSEIVSDKTTGTSDFADVNLFVNCISGATSLGELIRDVEQAGFVDVAPVRVGPLKVSGQDLERCDSGIASVLLRGRKPMTPIAGSQLSAARILMLGASDAALVAARHYGLRPTILTMLDSKIPAIDAFDVITFDGSPHDAMRKCLELCGRADIRGVVAFEGPYIGVAQALARHFDRPSYFPSQIVEGGENKLSAKQAMKSAGVSVPTFWFGSNFQSALDWSISVGWPVVAKPANDANSRMVRLCRDSEDLSAAVEQILSASKNVGGLPLAFGVLLEKFIDGPEFSVEIISLAGQSPKVVTVCEKLLGPEPFFVEIGHAVPPSLRSGSLEAIKSMAIRATQAVGAINIVCHVEVRLAEGDPFIIEVNLRPPGGKLTELIRAVSGWDLPRAAVELACGLPLHTPPDDYARCGIYHCITTDFEAVIDYEKRPVELEDTQVAPYVEMDVPPGAYVYPVNYAKGQILGRILAYGNSPGEVWNVIRKIKQTMNLRLTPLSADEKNILDRSCSGCWETGCC